MLEGRPLVLRPAVSGHGLTSRHRGRLLSSPRPCGFVALCSVHPIPKLINDRNAKARSPLRKSGRRIVETLVFCQDAGALKLVHLENISVTLLMSHI